ncbi:MAG: glycosyl hydrolase family 28-related protein, partial [Kiritimatiellota bacterium]|nr:glycosyl hydrolase family 28-related protein [Kiritimatiellota bacterium]
LVYGSGFDAKSVDFRFDFADWPTSRVAHASGDKAGAAAAAQEEEKLARASFARMLNGKASLGETPAADARGWRAADTNRDANTLLAERARNEKGVALLRVRTPEGISAPFVVNRPEIWGISPRCPRAGEVVTVWGVNLGEDFAIAGADGNAAELVKGYRAYNDHSGRPEGRFVKLITAPGNLSPGRYTLYNLWGTTDAGWSLGKEMTVQGGETNARPLFKVREFGAAGDGQTDDTAAVRAAIAKAKEAGNGMVFFDSGRYVVSATLAVPDGVKLMGVSRDASVIEACRRKPFDVSAAPLTTAPCLVALQVGGELEGLGLDVTRGANNIPGSSLDASVISIILVRGGEGPGPVIRDCRLRGEVSARYRGWPHQHIINGVHVWDITRDMVFENNEVTVTGDAFLDVGGLPLGHRIRFNLFRHHSPHSHNCAFVLKDNREALIEGNIWENTGRGLDHQSQHGTALRHNLYMHNIFRNLRKIDGDILLYETGSTAWDGRAASVLGNRVLLAGEPDFEKMIDGNVRWLIAQRIVTNNVLPHRVLFISEGRGIGQLREIVGTEGATVIIERPWDVNPDETSRLVILTGGAVENLHVGNEYFDSHQWVGIYGAGLRNVWVNDVYERVSGGTYLWKTDGYRLMALNLIYVNKYHERAGIAVVNSREGGGETDKLQVFGNEFRNNSIEDRAYVSTENGQNAPRLMGHQVRRDKSNALSPLPGREPGIGIFDMLGHPEMGAVETDPAYDALPISTKWNLIYGNQIVRCPIGIEIGKAVANTIVIG